MSREADFNRRLRHALDSPTLGTALDRFLTAFRERREAGFAGRDFEAGRATVVALKRDAIERLPELVAQFTEEAQKVGAVVHMARDAAHARRIIAGLAQERGVKRIVKGKSMATEEIELNPHLEGLGIEVVETDLGEWIIQLAHERPSHLIAPAIHKTREEVAALFREKLGENPDDDDIEEMVAIARRRLREAFINADMGITGANVAVAETGSLVIVSNEGNQRLVSTLPPIHVAVLGIEKIVPTLEDAVAILQMLPRSATGQKISSYVSIIAGPSRTGDIELSLTTGVHGPKEVHIILLDNGRWRMREDPDFSEALRCIRCAACSNVCPSYQVVGGHVFGHIYTGPIGLVLTPWHHGLENAAGPQSLCAGCNACETVCPAGIPLPQLIMEVRRQTAEEFGLSWSKQAALNAFADPPAFKRWMGLASLVQAPFQRGKTFVKPPFAPGFRSLPVVARRPLHDRLTGLRQTVDSGQPLRPKPGVPINGATGMTVSYFPGCITNWAYPDMGEAVVRAVEALGARVQYPPEQWCCG
ncbi:MAG: LUD domain-containing protein, partial [Chloroflexi bacterium]|nr:LUD domain-containing protein [Chloroflexota bacterium]